MCSNAKVGEIAAEVGYALGAAFSRVFKPDLDVHLRSSAAPVICEITKVVAEASFGRKRWRDGNR